MRSRPSFDPELATVLDRTGGRVPCSITPGMIPLLRAQAPEGVLDGVGDGHFREEEHAVPGPEGHQVPVSVWMPARPGPATGVLVWIHGGGMISGTHRGPELPGLLALAREADLAVVSVDYRLAPENPHPAPVEDCHAVLAWAFVKAEAWGLDAARVVVAGASAGGGLAAATCLLTRDRGGRLPRAQMLLYPMLDDRNDSVSAHQMRGAGVWDRVSNDTGWGALLQGRQGTVGVSPYAAPARAEDLSGLPPVFLDVGSAETFRDEVVAFASRMWSAGGHAELHVWPGACHAFDELAPEASVSRSAVAQRLPWLLRVLGR